jgi:hypothetical protein
VELEANEGITFQVSVPPPPTVEVEAVGPSETNPVYLMPVPGAPGARGQSGTNSRVYSEAPTATPEGSDALFTLANNYTPGSTAVYRNGIRGLRGFDYNEWPPNQIAFDEAPRSYEEILVDYDIA